MHRVALAPGKGIGTDTFKRRAKLSQREFYREHILPRVPVVLTDAMEGWSSLDWSPEFFDQSFGARKVVVACGPEWRKMPISTLIKTLRKGPDPFRPKPHNAGTYYLRNRHIGEDFPELMNSFTIAKYFSVNWLALWPLGSHLPFAKKELVELFIGPKGARGPNIHRDSHMTHAWISQVYGQKRVWMVSPADDACMYPDPSNHFWSLVKDFEHPDLQAFPLFEQAKVYSTILSPGETIFVPAGWWHTAECASPSISLSGNFADRSNFRDFRKTMVLRQFSQSSRLHRNLNSASLVLHEAVCSLRALLTQLSNDQAR